MSTGDSDGDSEGRGRGGEQSRSLCDERRRGEMRSDLSAMSGVAARLRSDLSAMSGEPATTTGELSILGFFPFWYRVCIGVFFCFFWYRVCIELSILLLLFFGMF